MDPAAPAARPLSALAAAQQAAELVKQRLFPFNLQRWVALGFVAFLDRCGRGGGGGGGGNWGIPGGPSGDGSGASGASGAADELASMTRWVIEHLAIIIAAGIAILALVIALMALVTFLRSRGTFMYIDDVATGRAEIVRPWREHADRAWSFFAWAFGVSLAALAVALVLAVPLVAAIVSMIRSGPSCLTVGGIVALILTFIGLGLGVALFNVLLRDFAAPLQLALGVPCGTALGVAWGLVKANPLTFLAYLALKIVFGILLAFAALFAGCFTCCIGFLPVISHTILQPLFYFERAWSLFLLRQAGYDVFPAPPLPAG